MVRRWMPPALMLAIILFLAEFQVFAETDWKFQRLQEFESERQPVNVVIDGRMIQPDDGAVPFIEEHQLTMIPIRYLEEIGAVVEWDEQTRSAMVQFRDLSMTITEGENVMLVNGQERTLAAEPAVIRQRMLVPARNVVETLGAYIGWDPKHKNVVISTSFMDDRSFEIPGDNVFLVEDLAKVASLDYFVPAGGRFLFSDPEANRYYFTLSEEWMPGLNKRVFDLSKILFHADGYNTVQVVRDDVGQARVQIGLSADQAAAEAEEYDLLLELPESAPLDPREEMANPDLMEQAVLKMTIRRLNLQDSYADGIYAVPDMERRLKNALIYTLGREIGTAAYRDIYTAYMDRRFDPDREPIAWNRTYSNGWTMSLAETSEGMLVIYFNKGETNE